MPFEKHGKVRFEVVMAVKLLKLFFWAVDLEVDTSVFGKHQNPEEQHWYLGRDLWITVVALVFKMSITNTVLVEQNIGVALGQFYLDILLVKILDTSALVG